MKDILNAVKTLLQTVSGVKVVKIGVPDISDFTNINLPAVIISPMAENGHENFMFKEIDEVSFPIQIFVISEAVNLTNQEETAILNNCDLTDLILTTLETDRNLSGVAHALNREFSKEYGVFLQSNNKIFSACSKLVVTYLKQTDRDFQKSGK